MSIPRTLHWEGDATGGALWLLDQRLLPHAEEELELRTLEETVAANDGPAVWVIAVGLDLSAVGLARAGGQTREHGVSLGVHGVVGLHGFVGKRVYWRGAVGYLGAGVNGLTGQLMLGYVFGRD